MKSKGTSRSLYLQVLIGVLAGGIVGLVLPSHATDFKLLGDLFVKLVKMMIAPVVFCTIVPGIADMSKSGGRVGRIMIKSLILFQVFTLFALGAGLVAVLWGKPGAGMNVDPTHLDVSGITKFTQSAAHLNFHDFVLNMVPSEYFGALANGKVLPVLLLSILTGFSLGAIGSRGEPVARVIDAFSHVVFQIFNLIMRLAPIGAFGAMAFTVGKYGLHSLGSMLQLMGTFYAACLAFIIVILGLTCRLCGFSLWKLLSYIREELLVVLGTSSTEPVLPRMMQKLEKLGCERQIVGLALPTGYSFNLSGTAIYLTLASLFIAQACNINLTLSQILTMIGIMLLSSKGAAGVSGSGFVALVATLTVVPTVPVAGIALIIGIDRFMSEARALTSLVANAVAVIVVAMWEKGCNRAVLSAELSHPTPIDDELPEPALPAEKIAT